MRTATLRLDDCGDTLNLQQYCAWRGLSERQVRDQVKAGKCFVTPCEEKPHLRWRRADCERRLNGADIIRERQQRAKDSMRLAS